MKTQLEVKVREYHITYIQCQKNDIKKFGPLSECDQKPWARMSNASGCTENENKFVYAVAAFCDERISLLHCHCRCRINIFCVT